MTYWLDDLQMMTHWLEAMEFDFHAGLLTHIKIIDTNDTPRPFTYVKYLEFRKVEGYAITERRETISKCLHDMGLNNAVIQTQAGTLVFTEEPFDYNPILFKLTTGSDIGVGQEFQLNEFLEKNDLQDKFPELYRGAE